MPLWLQHLLVVTLVVACAAVVVRQLVGTFRMTRGSKLGTCCASGCEAQPSTEAGLSKPDRIVFIPSSTLTRRSS